MSNSSVYSAFLPTLLISSYGLYPQVALAQTVPNLPNLPNDFQRSPNPKPLTPQPLLPDPPDLLPTPTTPNLNSTPSTSSDTILIKKFEVVGNTVFSPAELARITAPYTNKNLSFNELLQVAEAITKHYRDQGYISSGAYIPNNQTFSAQNATVRIQVVEGRIEDIVVTGTQQLDPNYIRSRIALGAQNPLKFDRLLESLRLLQQDPLLKTLNTELTAGRDPSSSRIIVKVTENPTWQASLTVANNRTPSVGEIQATASIARSNLTGSGDSLNATYGRSEGSSAFEASYTRPLNPNNGTIKLQYGSATSRVVEDPFDQLDINGASWNLALSYRQPILRTTTQELALGLTADYKETNTSYLAGLLGSPVGYPTPGADDQGTTSITAARFFQDYTVRDTQQVFAARSQLSVGLGTGQQNQPPHGSFVAWRGQTQYVHNLALNTLLLVKLEGQVADRPLVALEQIGVGGADTVRGYRQDLLLGDNGLVASAEVRIPIFTSPNSENLLQLVPFVDFGAVSQQSGVIRGNIDTIASAGLGLRYQGGNNFLAKLDYGMPLTAIDQRRRTGQESGWHLSINYNQSF